MRVLVTGVNGQLGHDVMLELVRRGYKGIGSGSGEAYRGTDDLAVMPYIPLDITDQDDVNRVIMATAPDTVIHCSAWTAVDAAEEKENRTKVFALNTSGPEYLAKACKAVGAKMIYLSTDYVFNGQGTIRWKPEDRNYAPLNVYGQSKLEGVLSVAGNMDNYFIVRTSWVFGINGTNFISTMIRLGKAHDTVRVVSDQIGTPTYTKDLARLLVDMSETEKYGTYHVTNEGGYCSWFEFCQEVYRQYGLETQIIPVTTAEFGLNRAVRPFNSRLDKSKLSSAGFEPLPDWQDAIGRYLKEAQL